MGHGLISWLATILLALDLVVVNCLAREYVPPAFATPENLTKKSALESQPSYQATFGQQFSAERALASFHLEHAPENLLQPHLAAVAFTFEGSLQNSTELSVMHRGLLTSDPSWLATVSCRCPTPEANVILSGVDLLVAINNSQHAHMAELRLQGNITIDDEAQHMFPNGVRFQGEELRLQPEVPDEMPTLDFGHHVGVVRVAPGALLSLEHVTIRGIGSKLGPGVGALDYVDPNNGIWPSVLWEPNSSMYLNYVTVFLNSDNCSTFLDPIVISQLQKQFGAGNISTATTSDGPMFFIDGNHELDQPVLSQGNFQVGYVQTAVLWLRMGCAWDPLLTANPLVPPAVSHSGGNGTMSWWAWLLVALGALLLLLLLLLLVGVVSRAAYGKRRRQGRTSMAEVKDVDISQGQLQLSTNAPLHPSMDVQSCNSIQTWKNDHAACSSTLLDWSVQRLAEIGRAEFGIPEGLQLGRMVGRGGYGRVYKGRWLGAVVAVKIIDHEGGQGKDAILGESLKREIQMSTTVMHPNVVTTYRFWTMMVDPEVSDDPHLLLQPATTGLPRGGVCDSLLDPPCQLPPASPRSSSAPLIVMQNSSTSTSDSLSTVEPHAGQVLDLEANQRSITSPPPLSARLPTSCPTPDTVTGLGVGDSGAFSVGVEGGEGGRSHAVGTLVQTGSVSQNGLSGMPGQVRATSGAGGEDGAGSGEQQHCAMYQTWLALEFCDRGSLKEAIQNGAFMQTQPGMAADGNEATGAGKPMKATRNMGAIYRSLIDVAAGLEYLHSLSICHGDLKSANVLLKSAKDPRGFVCKIADFSLSRMLNLSQTHEITRTYGTLAYMPPELLGTGLLTTSADVYSFAVLMWELFTGQEPYPNHTMGQIIYAVVYMGNRPVIPVDCPDDYAELMSQCWAAEPFLRPTFVNISQRLREQFLSRATILGNEMQPEPPQP